MQGDPERFTKNILNSDEKLEEKKNLNDETGVGEDDDKKDIREPTSQKDDYWGKST